MAEKELLWICKCGWIGTASQMIPETYCCPQCNKFDDLKVVIEYKMPEVYHCSVSCA